MLKTSHPFPAGTVTFLFTDLEDSTRLWEAHPHAMKAILARHDALIQLAVTDHNGHIVKKTGDGFLAVFASALDAALAAAAAQKRLQKESWPQETPIKVRTGMHTGEAEVREGDYYGSPVNRAARIMGLASGGQVLCSETTQKLVRDNLPEGTTFESLGLHPLRGLQEPEHIYQMLIAGCRSDFPPLQTDQEAPHNLPSQVTPFVGREEEISDLKNLVVKEKYRLVTILAPGGSGKTRLSLEVAQQVRREHKDGVYFFSLARLKESEQLVQAIVETLDITFSNPSEGSLKDQLLGYFRKKNMLLVMDNFEHLLAGVSLLSEIIAAAPGVSILASSREKLNLHGEVVFEIKGLRFTEWRSPAEVMQDSAGRLFMQSARQAKPGFEIRENDLVALSEICRRVQGMPLAILLAAAWVDLLPLDVIAQEISQSLDFLETDQHGIPDRQQSIRAVFDYSWSLLDESDRDLFKKLSVFSGGFTRQAAQAVTGASLRALAKLANKSLLVSDTQTARYGVHELLRQYSREKLAQDPDLLRQVQDAHAEHYTDFMARTWEDLTYWRQKEALIEIVNDIDNVRSAWMYCSVRKKFSEMEKFIYSLWMVYEVRGWYAAGADLFRELAQTLRLLENDAAARLLLSQALAGEGWFINLTGDPVKGAELGREGIEIARQSPRPEKAAFALQTFNMGLMFQNRMDEAGEINEAVYQLHGDRLRPWWQAHHRVWLSLIAYVLGNFEQARAEAEKALAIYEKIGEYWGLNWGYLSLSFLARDENDLQSLRTYCRRILDANLVINFRRGLQINYNRLGDVALQMGLVEEAKQNYLESLKISEEIGQTREILSTLSDLANLLIENKQQEKAVELLALIHNSPGNAQYVHDRTKLVIENVKEMAEQLEMALPAEEFSKAWERGQTLDLEEVVSGLLAEMH